MIAWIRRRPRLAACLAIAILAASLLALRWRSGERLYAAAARGDVQGCLQASSPLVIDHVHWDLDWVELRASRMTALMVAARDGHEDVVRCLLDAGADPDVIGTEGGTALTLAASRFGRERIVRLLLDHGADPLAGRPLGRSALAWSAIQGDAASVRALLEASRRAGMSASEIESIRREAREYRSDDLRHLAAKMLENGSDEPELVRAARLGDSASVARLLAEGSDVDVAQGDGWTAMLWASGPEGDTEVFRELLRAGADANRASRDGYAPILAAVLSGSLERVDALLRAGARASELRTIEGTLLHTAVWMSTPDLVRALLESGADPLAEDDVHRTALRCAEARAARDDLPRYREVFEEFALERGVRLRPDGPDDVALAIGEGDSAGELWTLETCVRRTSEGEIASGSFWISGPTADIAYDVYWKWDGGEAHVGQVADRSYTSRGFHYEARLEDHAPDVVELVLRPNRDLAFAELRSWKILGKEVSLGTVVVSRE